MKRMMKIIGMLVFFVVGLCVTSHAEEAKNWSLQAKVYKFIPSDSDNVIQSSIGFQAQAIHKKSGMYPYFSYENIPLRFGGQSGRGSEVKLQSLGFGIEKQIVKNLNLFFQVGWYQPKIDGQDKVLWKDHIAEGLALHLNNRLDPTPPTFWEYYSVEYSGNIGGVIGAAWTIPITNNIEFSISGAYRYLRLKEMLKGYNKPKGLGWWEYQQNRDFGGGLCFCGFNVKF